ncbi:MAG TPA: glycosyltransferase family 39 protein [Acidobacteriaceae bacterium]|nr:glycosyltransferase family 39 protein [Acidobacteriaceae bacterium]
MADATLVAEIVKCRLARAMVVVFVLLTAAVSLAWSHNKLMSQDEMYAFQTYSMPTVAELVHVQRTEPISLDPLLYPLLSHAAMKAFGASEFALRLPALLGFLLMQVCLFFFVRNVAGERAGVVAAAFPALTATLFYSAEGRPYGLMLGLYALALWCWQVASKPTPQNRDMGHPNSRKWSLAGLAAAIAATINAHYFGILLLVPICAAEGFRSVQRRRMDWPMCAAICAGMAGFAATGPFLQAADEFRKNYYNAGTVGLHDITLAYRSIFVDYTRMSMSAQHLWMVVLVAFAAALLWGCARVVRGREVQIPAAQWVLLLVLAALPFCGYLLARFVTHSIEVRYVLGAVVAISAMLAVAASPWLKRDAVFNTVLVALGLAIVGAGAARIVAEQHKSAQRMSSLVLPAEVKAALLANPDGRLYMQDMGAFEEARYYEPDPDVRARMTLVYSRAEEMRWNRHDTMALTAMHIARFTRLPVVSYEALRAMPGEHLFVLYHTGWDWTDQAFAAGGAKLRSVGQAMGGDVAAVRF